MKFVIALVTLGLAVAFVSAADWESAKKKITEAHNKCNEDPSIALPEEVIEKLKKGEKPEPSEKLANHMLCVSKHLGWQNADGKINKDLVKERITSYVSDATKQEEFITECTTDKDTPTATAAHLFRCIGSARRQHLVQ